MKSGSSGLQLTDENTVQDLAMSFTGGVLAATTMVTLLWPKPGTPRTLFGWSNAGATSHDRGRPVVDGGGPTATRLARPQAPIDSGSRSATEPW
jgi:hypothetical protein